MGWDGMGWVPRRGGVRGRGRDGDGEMGRGRGRGRGRGGCDCIVERIWGGIFRGERCDIFMYGMRGGGKNQKWGAEPVATLGMWQILNGF